MTEWMKLILIKVAHSRYQLLGAGLTVNVTTFQEEAQPAHHVLVGGPLAGEGVVEARGGAGRLTAPLRHLGRSNGSGGTRPGRYDDE